jgi:hypothetical protein
MFLKENSSGRRKFALQIASADTLVLYMRLLRFPDLILRTKLVVSFLHATGILSGQSAQVYRQSPTRAWSQALKQSGTFPCASSRRPGRCRDAQHLAAGSGDMNLYTDGISRAARVAKTKE